MDERKSVIRELEEKKRALAETRNRLLTGLGETLIQRIGDEASFQENPEGSPAVLLSEYRKIQEDIAESSDAIKSLEADIVRLKELEEKITAREGEQSFLAEELEQVHIRLGMTLLSTPDSNDLAAFVKQQEESLLSKITEHEKILEELEEQKGNFFSWLGKNAKIAVEKAFLSKSRSELQKLYRSAGEEFLAGKTEIPEGDIAEYAKKASELKEHLLALTEELAELKGERRKIGGVFGSESSPSRRIQGLQKNIVQRKKEIPVVYLNFGSLAANGEKESFSPFLKEEDLELLKNAESLASEIAEAELSVKKVKAAINIDKEKAEIEKMKKAILDQRRKIFVAEEAITGYEKHIAESEQYVEELSAFIQGDHGS